MQYRCYKTMLTLFVQVAAFLALSIPTTGYTDNSIRSFSGYRGSHQISSGYRNLDRGHRKHSTHRQNSRNSHFAAIKQNNSVVSNSGNRDTQRLSSRSRDLNKSQGSRSSTRQERNHKRPGTVKQRVINSRNEHFKTRKNSVVSTSGNRGSHRHSSRSRDLNKGQELQASSRQEGYHRQRENVVRHKTPGYISHHKRPGTVKQQIISGRNEHFKTRKNPVASNLKQKNIVLHKNQRLTKNIKPQVNRTQVAAIRPDKIKEKVVATNPRKNVKSTKAIGQHKNNLGNKNTVVQTQHKKHNSHKQHKQNISHSRHHHQKHHRHHKHHGHFTRHIFSPFVFFSYSTLYYPYSYYPYTYPVYRDYGYSSPAYSYEGPVYSANNPYGIDSPGWYYLAQENLQAAINTFAKDIESYPGAGIPKVGYALASAAAGNLTEGVLAMREAFNIDPDSIHYIYFDEELLQIIDDLIEKYEYELQQSNKRPDKAFMVFALHYLKYNYGNAHEAINRAIADGDKSPSLGKLHRLVDEQFSNEYADEHRWKESGI